MMSSSSFNCLECGEAIGGDTNQDVYSHLLNCLHVDNVGVEQLRSKFGEMNTEHARRVLYVLNKLSE
jgi:hypothetical protein